MMNRGIKAFLVTLAVLVILSAGFVGGAAYDRVTSSGASPIPLLAGSTSDPGALVDQVRGLVRQQALVPSSDTSMTTDAIDGVLASLEDSHSQYFDPKQFVEFNQQQSGEFYGIGVVVGLDTSSQPVIAQVFSGTPAAKAGLKAGDVIYSANGVHRAKWDLDAFVAMVRGAKGTRVTLVVKRGKQPLFTLKITRDRITVPDTMTKMYGKVGYIRLAQFDDNAAAGVKAGLTALAAKGAKSYVIDLRENPGGLVSQAVAMVSMFVPEGGVVVRVDARGAPERDEYATGGAVTNKPGVLLVDANSASAAEIVTGALHDYGRAIVVGTRTYGKGSIQTIFPLRNSGAVKFTTAHYLTPKKHVIDKIGVTPDVVVPMDPQLQSDPAHDTQLQRALRIAESKIGG
jgi:carboxyl-terminal processing protease